jgi:hypothetical protein
MVRSSTAHRGPSVPIQLQGANHERFVSNKPDDRRRRGPRVYEFSCKHVLVKAADFELFVNPQSVRMAKPLDFDT